MDNHIKEVLKAIRGDREFVYSKVHRKKRHEIRLYMDIGDGKRHELGGFYRTKEEGGELLAKMFDSLQKTAVLSGKVQ